MDFFPVAFSSGIVVGWPARPIAAGKESFYVPDDKVGVGKISFFAITDPKRWDALLVEWLSPLAQRKDLGKVYTSGVAGRQQGRVMTLDLLAARNAYWRLNKTTLERLCRYYGVVIARGANLFTLLHDLVAHVTEASEAEVLDILQKRVRNMNHDSTLQSLLRQEAYDLCEKKDQKELAKSDKEYTVEM